MQNLIENHSQLFIKHENKPKSIVKAQSITDEKRIKVLFNLELDDIKSLSTNETKNHLKQQILEIKKNKPENTKEALGLAKSLMKL